MNRSTVINVVPQHHAPSTNPSNDPASGRAGAWVSADGLWPPIYLPDSAVQNGAYRTGCGEQHHPAERCGTVGCHGRLGDDNDPVYQQRLAALVRCWHRLADLERDATLMSLHLIAYTVHKAAPQIAYVCLDWSGQGEDILVPTGTYLTGDHREQHDDELSDRLDDTIRVYTSLLTDGNHVVWQPFTESPPTTIPGPDVWLDVAAALAGTPAGRNDHGHDETAFHHATRPDSDGRAVNHRAPAATRDPQRPNGDRA